MTTRRHTDPNEAAGQLAEALARDAAPSGEAVLRALGFREAGVAWRHLGSLTRALTPPDRDALVRALAHAMPANAAPDMALLNFLRFGEARFGADNLAEAARLEPFQRDLLLELFGFSQYMADTLIRRPHLADWLCHDEDLAAPRTRDVCAGELRTGMRPHADPRARREAALVVLRREMLRLGVRRMLGRSDEAAMTAELSELARAVLEVGLEECSSALQLRFGHPHAEAEEGSPPGESPRSGFCVVGLGKLGGGELNYSSDIDLMFVYGDEGRTTGAPGGGGRIDNHRYFTRLAEALVAWVGEAGDEGFFFRVDTRLRPDGETGPLARSLAACEIYYTAQARLWERLALVRGRVVAGDATLGKRFEAMSRALALDPLRAGEYVAEMREMKRRIDARLIARDREGRDIKLSAGGIRELEFIVQTQQVIHGIAHPELWTPRTRDALARLAELGLMDAGRARQLGEDYTFLRTVEHRMQMLDLRQTHLLPESPRELDELARRCGILGDADDTPGRALARRWREIARRVNGLFVEYFDAGESGRGGRVEFGGLEPAARVVAIALGDAPEGFDPGPLLAHWRLTPRQGLKSLQRLAGGGGVLVEAAGREAFERLLPTMLEACRTNPRPERALAAFETLMEASGGRRSYYQIFADNRAMFELLFFALGASDALARTLTAHPEFIDYLGDPELLAAAPDRRRERERLTKWIAAARAEHDDARWLATVVRWKRFELLADGLAELKAEIGDLSAAGEAAGTDYVAENRAQLAAELTLETIVERAAREMRHAWPLRGFAVMGLGKLGTGELNAWSDLDLLFVWDEGFDGADVPPAERAAALAERIVQWLTRATPEGHAYDVDARLRPEGSGAPLAPPLGRFVAYYDSDRAQLWEYQTVMKLRALAGDPALGDRMARELGRIVARRTEPGPLGERMRAMRERIKESASSLKSVFADLKKSPGGTIDLEFIAQYLQLRHLPEAQGLIGLSPPEVFARAEEAGWLDREVARGLIADYRWMRRLERRVRMLNDSERTTIPAGGEKLEALELAFASGRRDGRPLLDSLREVMRRNRERFEGMVR